MKVELSDGQWAELRDPETITNRDRGAHDKRTARAVDRAADVEGIPVEEVTKHPAMLGTYIIEELLKDMLVDWSLDLPLPSERPDVFDDDRFPWLDRQLLIQAMTPVAEALTGVDFAPKYGPGDKPDHSSPTPPS